MISHPQRDGLFWRAPFLALLGLLATVMGADGAHTQTAPAFLVHADGSVTGTLPGPTTRAADPVEDRPIRGEFGLPDLPATRRWQEDDTWPICHTRWEHQGIHYTQSVLIITLHPEANANPGTADALRVLLIQIKGENHAPEYTEARAALQLTIDGQPAELELRDGLVYRTAAPPSPPLAAVDIPAEGIEAAAGRRLKFRGHMPPGTSGTMLVKIPLRAGVSKERFAALQHVEFGEELRRVKKLWSNRGSVPAEVGATVRFAPQPTSSPTPSAPRYFGIQVVDEQTGRGVPLVELETVHHLRYITDNAGWVAFAEPGLMGRPVFFHVRSHGYAFPKDGFGFEGVALKPVAGEKATLRLRRVNLAERLYRVTGEGLYRDSVLLGEPTPLAEPLGTAQVAGQDSVQALPYRGRLYWFWGDTSRLRYPLGHFWMAAAVSDFPGRGGLDPAHGVNLRYFVDAEGFSRPVCRLGVERGLMWADGFLTVTDAEGRERMLTHYAHMESLAKMLDHGLALFNDDTREFTRLRELDLQERWRFPRAHPVRHRDDAGDYYYFGDVFPTARVRADLASVTNPASYEAWTCLRDGVATDALEVERDGSGQLQYGWKKHADPLDPALEQRLLAAGKLRPDEARYLPVGVGTDQRVKMHRGSVRWNGWRQRWIMIAGQEGGRSLLGEIWYAEAPKITGPWKWAKKIVTHDRYDFYNPVHHPFLDQDGGRRIYFEGTYVNTFSGHPIPTPRYDYNQIMYRLDLADPRLSRRAGE